ncbi:MAG TPA: class F sortase [Acidimicrobiales bacterium]
MRLEIRLWWVVAVELVAAGFGLALLQTTTPQFVHAPIPHVSHPPSPQLLQSVRAATPPPARSAPVSISVPALGIVSGLGPPRGLNRDGTIDDAPLAGPTWSLPWWYDAGASPGQPGSAVLLGHVDSSIGAGHLGVFFRLGDLAPGDKIALTLADGSLTRWTAVSNVLYPDGRFPNALVYSQSGPPTLRLVTCGGSFNWQTHHYESAVVVTAVESS